MKSLLVGVSRSVGHYVYQKIKTDHPWTTIGVGLGGPDVPCDLRSITTSAAARALIKRIDIDPCELNIFFFNAGVTKIDLLEYVKEQDWDETIQVNLTAPFFLTQALHSARWGCQKHDHTKSTLRCIYTLSMGARLALRHSFPYCASKAGLAHLVRTFARSLTSYNREDMLFYGINAGSMSHTDMIDQCVSDLQRTRGWTKDQAERYIEKGSAIERLCTHEEFYQGVRMLMTAPPYMTGSIIEYPGGTGI